MWKREPYTIPDSAFFMLGSLVALVSYGALVASYHALPELVPIHYGFTGTPDAYAEKSFLSVFGVALIHVGVSILMLWLHANPTYANIPGKVPLAKLKPQYRRSIEWIIRHMSVMMFVLMSLVFSYIALTDITVSLGFSDRLNPIPLAALILILITLNITYLVMVVRITRLATRRQKLPRGW